MDTAPREQRSGGAPSAAFAPPNKRRWLQFRLRTLLVLVVLLCLGLGGWQIYWTHFANYVVAGPVRVGEPIKVRGQFVDRDALDSTVYVVYATRPARSAPSGFIIYQSHADRVERSGRWTYRVETELAPLSAAGDYRLELRPINRPPVYGKLVVLPNKPAMILRVPHNLVGSSAEAVGCRPPVIAPLALA